MDQTGSNAIDAEVDLDISVLIATHNRAEMLRQTLENMTKIDRGGLKVEFVIIDNNSSDETSEVVNSFTNKLPIKHLFELKPGKNCALNRALREIQLGEIVVFTDDDVAPDVNWFKVIDSVTHRWNSYSVFGGRIYSLWQDGAAPDWIHFVMQRGMAILPEQYFGDEEGVWPKDRYPGGANFWVRRKIFELGYHFDERYGPRPTNRMMGSEASFLQKLDENGYPIIHSPSAIVGHYLTSDMLTFSAIRKRVWRGGRTGPNLCGLEPRYLYEKAFPAWFLFRIGGLLKHLLIYGLGCIEFSKDARAYRKLRAVSGISYNWESLRISLFRRNKQ